MMEQDRKEYLDKDESEKMCSSKIGEAGEMCSPADTDTCRDGCPFVPTETKIIYLKMKIAGNRSVQKIKRVQLWRH